MNKGGFTLRRLSGISFLKSRTSRKVGFQLTRNRRQQKIGSTFMESILLIPLFIVFVAYSAIKSLIRGFSKAREYIHKTKVADISQ